MAQEINHNSGSGVINNDIQTHIDYLLSAILINQTNFTGIKSPDPEKAKLISQELQKFSKNRGR